MSAKTELPTAPRIAVFVSPHGFGHASRAAAVMAALHRKTGAEFEIFTTVARWFFDESIPGLYRYHELECDVGFRQKSALTYDLDATVRALDRLVPFDEDRLDATASLVRGAQCRAVLCDIAPMGVAVAESCGLPSVLLESFSWPWLYEPLFVDAPALRRFAAELAEWAGQATVHLQTDPVCDRDPALELVPPIGRDPARDRLEVRRSLGIQPDRKLVVVTMGGYGEDLPFLDRLREQGAITFLVTGAAETGSEGNLLLFDNMTPLFMPDLLACADAVVAKLGYGTVAEVWREGLPFAWVTRPDFRETSPLKAFAERELVGLSVTTDEFRSGAWIERMPELLALPSVPRREAGGAARVAEVLAGFL